MDFNFRLLMYQPKFIVQIIATAFGVVVDHPGYKLVPDD